MVREWDPRTGSAAEIESLLDTLNAIVDADMPEDPHWRLDHLRDYLAEVMPGSRRISWVAQEDPRPDGRPGRMVGHLAVLLMGDIGVVDLLVHPDARSSGLGRAMLTRAARRVCQEGFRYIGAEVVGGTPAVRFYESLGFTREYVETRSVLNLSTVDWSAVESMAAGIDAGYHLEFCPGGPPEPLIEAYARTKAEARDAEDGQVDLDLNPSSYDPERLRDSLDCLHRRGMKPYIVLALHEATGQVAGLTELVVPAQHPSRADQYDTIVSPAHHGHGIDRAVKARMLLELRSAEPGVAQVQTWNAPGNEAMIRVNTELGFRPDREWCEYAVDVAELVHRLGTPT